MGAWGPAVFSDDTACDIRSDYREMLEDGVDDAEAMQRVITEYRHLADDEGHVLWLALAAAQVAVGRLDATVKTEALRIIDEGIGLDLWVEAGPKALASRKAALAKLRKALTGEQKARTKVLKPWVHVTDLLPGDVLAYRRHPEGRYALFRVARIEDGRLGAAPILRQLKWDKASLPADWRLRSLRTLAETKAGGPEPSTSFHVARNKKKDPDWRDVGLSRISRVDVAPDDNGYSPRSYCDWRALSRNLDNRW
ncbi:DUF4259 domain-containing protein [Nocardioides dilutus]